MTAVPEVERFIRDHVGAVSAGDVESFADAFASPYLEATPRGHTVRAVDRVYRLAQQERIDFLRAKGFRSADLTSIQSDALDPGYVLVRASWRMVFASGDELLEALFDRSYVVSTIGERYLIIFHVLHADEDNQLHVAGVVE